MHVIKDVASKEDKEDKDVVSKENREHEYSFYELNLLYQ